MRRALDYAFSIRLDLLYGSPKGEDAGNVRSFESTWMSGSLQAVVNLNNLKWNPGERKTAFYAFGGIGLNSFKAQLRKNEVEAQKVENSVAPQLEVGMGVAFRISTRINLGIEHKVAAVLGGRSDLLDGAATFVTTDDRSTFHDYLNYTSIRLNINLMGKGHSSEPLYWLNPLDVVAGDLQKLKDSKVMLNDTDGDGIIDPLDNEKSTPAGASVNAKGVTLDSDSDGVPDYQDQEPFSPPGFPVDAGGVAQKPDEWAALKSLLDDRLKNLQPVNPSVQPASGAPSILFIPLIYFDNNSTEVGKENLTTLATVADILKGSPTTKIVVTGYADEAGPAAVNNDLSYQRAKSVIDQLVSKYGVAEDRLILQWKGAQDPLVGGKDKLNRRVHLKIANGERPMAAPGK